MYAPRPTPGTVNGSTTTVPPLARTLSKVDSSDPTPITAIVRG
jgi:hypothetical protein